MFEQTIKLNIIKSIPEKQKCNVYKGKKLYKKFTLHFLEMVYEENKK